MSLDISEYSAMLILSIYQMATRLVKTGHCFFINAAHFFLIPGSSLHCRYDSMKCLDLRVNLLESGGSSVRNTYITLRLCVILQLWLPETAAQTHMMFAPYSPALSLLLLPPPRAVRSGEEGRV